MSFWQFLKSVGGLHQINKRQRQNPTSNFHNLEKLYKKSNAAIDSYDKLVDKGKGIPIVGEGISLLDPIADAAITPAKIFTREASAGLGDIRKGISLVVGEEEDEPNIAVIQPTRGRAPPTQPSRPLQPKPDRRPVPGPIVIRNPKDKAPISRVGQNIPGTPTNPIILFEPVAPPKKKMPVVQIVSRNPVNKGIQVAAHNTSKNINLSDAIGNKFSKIF